MQRDETKEPRSRVAAGKLLCFILRKLAPPTVAEPSSKMMPRPGVTDMSPARAPDLGATAACTAQQTQVQL